MLRLVINVRFCVVVCFSLLINQSVVWSGQANQAVRQKVLYEFQNSRTLVGQNTKSSFKLSFGSKLNQDGSRTCKWTSSVMKPPGISEPLTTQSQFDFTCQQLESVEILAEDLNSELSSVNLFYSKKTADNLILKMQELGFLVIKLTVLADTNSGNLFRSSDYEIKLIATMPTLSVSLKVDEAILSDKLGQNSEDEYDPNFFESLVDYILRPVKILTRI